MRNTRQSWDTSLKHLVRHGLLHDVLTTKQIAAIPSSNISRWKHEPDNKYMYANINKIIKEESDLIRKINQSSKLKNIIRAYFKLAETFHFIISGISGIKAIFKKNKDLIVNTIEGQKEYINIADALKFFNLSRATYQQYKVKVLYACEDSYFKWCTKRFSNQLLYREVRVIKEYLENNRFKFWSKSSIYLKALRDKRLQCSLTTFYKYCNLLGYKPRKKLTKKSDFYHPVITNRPHQLWCADVTIYKTANGTKHYIHILMDHYSKMILDYRIEKMCSARAITELLQNAYSVFKPTTISFLTDGGAENVNSTVTSFIKTVTPGAKHFIALKDVVYSNSMIEALNKVIKHQFLYPKNIYSAKALAEEFKQIVRIYNTIRPQLRLGGNTPVETCNKTPIDLTKYTLDLGQQKELRKSQNKITTCKKCI